MNKSQRMMNKSQRIMNNSQRITCNSQRKTLHFALCTLHSALCTLYFAHCRVVRCDSLSQRDSISITPALVLRPNNTESGVATARYTLTHPNGVALSIALFRPFRAILPGGGRDPRLSIIWSAYRRGGHRNCVLAGRSFLLATHHRQHATDNSQVATRK